MMKILSNRKRLMINKENIPSTEQLEKELKRLRYRQGFAKTLVNTVGSLIVVSAIAVIISTLLLPVLRMSGASMTPTLQNDEILLCSKLSDIEKGDIIAFYYNNKILIKRVIATSGDKINISEEGKVYLNDEELDEPYVNEFSLGECDIELPYQVPDNRIFVMGDNLPSKVIQNNEFRATLKMPILRSFLKMANFR